MGAMIRADVGDGEVWVGNPGRRLRWLAWVGNRWRTAAKVVRSTPSRPQAAPLPAGAVRSRNRSTQLIGTSRTRAMLTLASIMFACCGWLMA